VYPYDPSKSHFPQTLATQRMPYWSLSLSLSLSPRTLPQLSQ
jgi:hypothetical protein